MNYLKRRPQDVPVIAPQGASGPLKGGAIIDPATDLKAYAHASQALVLLHWHILDAKRDGRHRGRRDARQPHGHHMENGQPHVWCLELAYGRPQKVT